MIQAIEVDAGRKRESSNVAFKRFAIIGNYVPRQCGIATFTTDLCEAISAEYPELACLALPVNDRPEGYSYPPPVRFEIAQNDVSSYEIAADFLNINNIDLVCLQHEYGIFGGPAGSHILALLRELRMPLVTTLHTVLREPDPIQRRVLQEIAQVSDRLVVMSQRGIEFARDVYGIPENKLDFIPHGIPDVAFVDPNFYKDQFGLQGKTVLLTFGLLSPNKGIENVIQALPEVIKRFPNTVYLILGATHPHIRIKDGESYRLSLERLARSLAVDQNVIFHNRFVSQGELIEFLGAADIYITPYLNEAQIVSGTLAYSVGVGKAVISTPYWYAEELLSDGVGRIVPFSDPDAISRQVISLLENEAERHAMRKRAYLKGREMVWPKVARLYVRSFEHALEQRRHRPRPLFSATSLNQRSAELPDLRLDHLERMTDNTGLLQHAIFTHPNFDEGYTTDDNARALVLAVLLEQSGNRLSRTHCYLAFLWHAFNKNLGRFRNQLSYERCWMDQVGSEDCHGRALWALGMILGRSRDEGFCGSAGRLFNLALPAARHFTSLRAWAYTLLGLHEYLRRFSGDREAQAIRQELVGKLVDCYEKTHVPEWLWFEDVLAYCNATIPHALLVSGRAMAREELIDIGLTSLRWLSQVQCPQNDHLVPIGSNGFYRKGELRARFDQQPVEAHCTVSACLQAWQTTQDDSWLKEAQRAFEWFLGRNDLGLSLYNPSTGGCRDGLHADRVNQNEGAESTLSFLIALEEMRQSRNTIIS